MTDRVAPFRIALTLTLAGLGVGAFGPGGVAHAQRALQLSAQEKPGYARIIAKWGDGSETAPKVTASVASQVLIIGFEEPVKVDVEALRKGLPSWAAMARLDADGRTARVALKQTPKVKLSTSIDLAAIDLTLAGAAPPPLVSPLVAKRAAEAERARQASLPPPAKTGELEVRGSKSGDSSRVAFYWEGKVPYSEVSSKPGELQLLFAQKANPDIAYIKVDPPPNLAGYSAVNTDRGYLVTIKSRDNLPIRHFIEGEAIVVDISKPGADVPHDDGHGGAHAAPKPAAGTKTPAAKSGAAPAKPAAPKAPPPTTLHDEMVAAKEEEAFPEGRPVSLAPPVAPDRVIGGAARETALAGNWPEPVTQARVIDVRITRTDAGVEFRTDWASPAPAAIFSRNGVIWAVFGAAADLRINQSTVPQGFKVRSIAQPKASLLRIEAPRNIALSAQGVGPSWIIRTAPHQGEPPRILRPNRIADPVKAGRTRIETMLPGSAGIVWFIDPAIGDEVAAVLAFGPSASLPTSREFVEASLLASAHGLAVAPKSDEVQVSLEGERAVVTLATGATSNAASTAAGAGAELGATGGKAAFVDFKAWGGLAGAEWFARYRDLEGAIAGFEPGSRESSGAMMELVRFLLGHEMAPEALGLLEVIVSERPLVEQDANFLGLRAAANVMARRFDEAEKDLSRGPLREEPSAYPWRAMVAFEKGEWERAEDQFRLASDQIFTYRPDWSAQFLSAWAETAFHTKDYDVARRNAEMAVASGEREPDERGQLVLAMLAEVTEGPAAGYERFAQLAKEASEPFAVRAELKRLELGVVAGKVSAADAASELESLRFRWRGDDVEMATVGILTDQYMRVGRFREALLLSQSAALREPDAPGARELRIRMVDYFRRLYLDGEADRIDPIQALALFYEFKHLTPIGADGDQMIRKLARRLVAFDLLEPAAELLQHQVDNRVRGVGRAAIAVDLASIYLMNRQPDRALAAINTSRQPALPKDLAMERRLLEAAAHRDLGRYDHVIELTEGLDNDEARSLLADAYWRDRKWQESAGVLMAMLPPPGEATPEDHAGIALRAAIAARMARDGAKISTLRAGYEKLFAGSPDAASFDLITSQADISGSSLSEAVRRLADAPRVDAYATAMKQRLQGATPKAPADPAPPA